MSKPEDTPALDEARGRIPRMWGTTDSFERKFTYGTLAAASLIGVQTMVYFGSIKEAGPTVVDPKFEAAVESASTNLDLLDDVYIAIADEDAPSYIKALAYGGKDHSRAFPSLQDAVANDELNKEFVAAQNNPAIGSYIVRVKQAETEEAAVEVLIEARSVAKQHLSEAVTTQDDSLLAAEPNGDFLWLPLGFGTFALVAAAGVIFLKGRRRYRSKRIIGGMDQLLKDQATGSSNDETEPGQSTEN